MIAIIDYDSNHFKEPADYQELKGKIFSHFIVLRIIYEL